MNSGQELLVDIFSDDEFDEDELKMKDNKTEYVFEVLSKEQIVQLMIDSIKKVSTFMAIPVTTARILLSHFKWDNEKLFEQFFDGSQEKLFEEPGVINPFRNDVIDNRLSQVSLQKAKSKAEEEECEICYIPCPAKQTISETKIMEEGLGETIACAAHNCRILVDDSRVMKLLKESKVKQRYVVLIINSFVERNRLLTWCPSTNCNNAIEVRYNECQPVTCKCKHTFCFVCKKNWHGPVK